MNDLEIPVYSVTQVNAVVKHALEAGVGLVAVQGEVSGFRLTKERLVYFELKDKQSRILCFMMLWDLRQQLSDGMEIKVYGTPSLFVKSGGLHFRVSEIELVGEGALKRAFELLKKKLEAEGLFREERKRFIPQFPERIGLITSSDGAAYTDIVRVLGNRWGGLEIILYPVGVQGYGAAESIAKAFHYFNTYDTVDVIIVARGGGSMEDLQAFNAEIVARAIFGSRAPVISGVGHERDTTIADFVADVRASTPSNAAERAVPERAEIVFRVDGFIAAIEDSLVEHHADLQRAILDMVGVFERPIREASYAIETMTRTLVRFMEQTMTASTQSLKETMRLLSSLNPKNILARGYGIVRHKGKIIHTTAALALGDTVEVELDQGQFKGSVKEIV